MRAFERCGIALPMGSENLLGLLALESADVQADWQRLGMQPRSLTDVWERT